jgi:hypothetical protein
MPSYALSNAQATALARYFALRDGADFPYDEPRTAAPAGDLLTSALAALRKDCLTCHFVGDFPRERAKGALASLAPSLSEAHHRLRPDGARAWLADPPAWGGGHAGGPHAPAGLVDLVFALRDGTVLPPAGDEGRVPVLGLAH